VKVLAIGATGKKHLVATDSFEGGLEKISDCRSAGVKLMTASVGAPLSERAELADLVREIAGRADVPVNCAGYFSFVPFKKIRVISRGCRAERINTHCQSGKSRTGSEL
jgi:hypothetical protein